MRLVEDDYSGPRAATLGCPSPDVLMALGGDALPEEMRQPAEAHVAHCPACRALLADLNAIDVDVPESLDARVLNESRGAASWWKGALLPMAAVLVAAVALGIWTRRGGDTRRHEGGRARGDAHAPAAAAPQPGSWTIGKPALLLPLATALVVRGEEAEASRALAEALAPYRTDDYVAAERLLERVVAEYPASADAWFYLGSTRLLDGDPAGAREALDRARTLGVADRADEVEWLLATAEARIGRLDEARARLTTLCDSASAFKTPACDAKATLEERRLQACPSPDWQG